MSKKAPLTTQTQKVLLVIRKNKPIDLAKFNEWVKTYCDKYAYITHKDNVDPITNEIIPIHYHAVLHIIKAKSPLSVTLNSLVAHMGFDNADGIEIDKYTSEVASLQYLIHKNNPEKTQISSEEIVHNYGKEEMLTLLTCDSETAFTFDLCFSLCNRYDNVVELLRNIPPKMFKDNYKYIATIWNLLKYGKNEL